MVRKIVIMIGRVFAYFMALPLIIIAKGGILFLKSEKLFLSAGQFVSLLPGKVGIYIRSAFYRHTLSRYDLTTYVNFGTLISKRRSKIGKGCGIGAYSIIGYANIGDQTFIGSKVSIPSGRYQHNFTDASKGIKAGDGEDRCINIGNNVFIGEKALILADVGDNTIIGAGSVVVKSVPSHSVAVGNPARVVKRR